MKNKKQVIIASVAFALVVAIFVGVFLIFDPMGIQGKKDITVIVVHSDGTEATFNYTTHAKFLAEVLLDEGLVEGEISQETGLYIHFADGERAVWELDGAWWGLYIGDESSNFGASKVALTDGGVYKLVYSVG